jgi:uncharacterized protein (DUF433 family)
MPIVSLEYIEVDDRGVAKIVGSRSKVMQIVMDTMNGFSPEEIHVQYPHLSMAQIHAALAYYHDHKGEVDDQIAESVCYADEMRAKYPNQFTREELLARLSPADRDRLRRESESQLSES